MQKTINKLWAVLTLELICLFVVFLFAGASLRRSDKTWEALQSVRDELDRVASSNEAMNQRVDQLEVLLKSIQDQINALQTAHLSDRLQEKGKELIRHLNHDASSLGAVKPDQSEFTSGIHAEVRSGNILKHSLPDTSIAYRHLQSFKASLDEAQLLELSNRVDAAVFDLVSTASAVGDFSVETEKKVLEAMGPRLDALRTFQERTILLNMMSEKIRSEISRNH